VAHPATRPRMLALVAAGGAVGGALRAAVVTAWPARPGRIPWGTLTVNVAGAFVLGVLVAASLRPSSRVTAAVRALLGAGFCGAFTTMSSFAAEVCELVRTSHAPIAVTYAAATFGAGLLTAALGWRIARPR
jgi:fluoride exporter